MSARRKVLILGGDGMFAWDMHRMLEKDGGFEPIPMSRSQLDVTDRTAVRERVARIRPFAVVNTVGPLVDICEDHPDLASQINVYVVQGCASACQKVGARFVHLSTCGLFGDERKFYTEDDPVVLKTVYARTKYEGERAALDACADTLIVRPGWMYGGTVGHKKNFVVARLREARRRSVMQSATDKFGSPTWTQDAAEAVRQLLQVDGLRGVFHLCNTGGGSRAEYVQHILESAGVETPVEGVDSSAFPRRAQVPDCELLDNTRLNGLLREPMVEWREALARYIKTLDTHSI